MYFHIIAIAREQCELDMYIFKEVLDHIARVDRVLSRPGGSLLLAGRSGVGRRTSVRLVAHMHHMEIVTPHVARNYTVKTFKNDLKHVRIETHWYKYQCYTIYKLHYIYMYI